MELENVLAAVGGWNFGSDLFRKVIASQDARKAFAESAVVFMNKWGFDGLDLDWEYPNVTEKQNFTKLITEIHSAFQKEALHAGSEPFLLTAAVPAARKNWGGYDPATIAKYLDFVNLMSYDFYGPWDERTGFNAPLFSKDNFSVAASARMWLDAGVPRHKIVIGLASYGHAFVLDDMLDPSVNASAAEGFSGTYTRTDGFVAYYEACDFLTKAQTFMLWDEEAMVPYAYAGDRWISFDSVESLKIKVRWAKSNGFAGVMLWSLAMDDFSGELCSLSQGRRFPLMRMINEELKKDGPISHNVEDQKPFDKIPFRTDVEASTHASGERHGDFGHRNREKTGADLGAIEDTLHRPELSGFGPKNPENPTSVSVDGEQVAGSGQGAEIMPIEGLDNLWSAHATEPPAPGAGFPNWQVSIKRWPEPGDDSQQPQPNPTGSTDGWVPTATTFPWTTTQETQFATKGPPVGNTPPNLWATAPSATVAPNVLQISRSSWPQPAGSVAGQTTASNAFESDPATVDQWKGGPNQSRTTAQHGHTTISSGAPPSQVSTQEPQTMPVPPAQFFTPQPQGGDHVPAQVLTHNGGPTVSPTAEPFTPVHTAQPTASTTQVQSKHRKDHSPNSQNADITRQPFIQTVPIFVPLPSLTTRIDLIYPTIEYANRIVDSKSLTTTPRTTPAIVVQPRATEEPKPAEPATPFAPFEEPVTLRPTSASRRLTPLPETRPPTPTPRILKVNPPDYKPPVWPQPSARPAPEIESATPQQQITTPHPSWVGEHLGRPRTVSQPQPFNNVDPHPARKLDVSQQPLQPQPSPNTDPAAVHQPQAPDQRQPFVTVAPNQAPNQQRPHEPHLSNNFGPRIDQRPHVTSHPYSPTYTWPPLYKSTPAPVPSTGLPFRAEFYLGRGLGNNFNSGQDANGFASSNSSKTDGGQGGGWTPPSQVATGQSPNSAEFNELESNFLNSSRSNRGGTNFRPVNSSGIAKPEFGPLHPASHLNVDKYPGIEDVGTREEQVEVQRPHEEPVQAIKPISPEEAEVEPEIERDPSGRCSFEKPIRKDCHNFVQCVLGLEYEMPCPIGTVFNSRKGNCDWPSRVPECLNVFRTF